MKNLDILYEDISVIIINKPAGLAVQGGKNVKNSLDKILAGLRHPAPLLVHRLDKDTSGALLAAKTKEAASRFSGLRCGEKQYIAVCAGCPPKKEGIIDTELKIHNKVKKTKTEYKVIKTGETPALEYSVLEIKLGTGRMHQIRRHLAMIGCPVLGDDKYGDFKLNKNLRIKKLMLHAYRLAIIKEKIDVQAPLPSYFSAFI